MGLLGAGQSFAVRGLIVGLIKKLLAAMAFLPLVAQAKDIAIALNGMMGITVLTNEPCTYDKKLLAAYAHMQNKQVIYACWRLDGQDVIFSGSYPQLLKLPVKQFIETPKTK